MTAHPIVRSVHESAHAVVAVRLGLRIRSVTIRGARGNGGECELIGDADDPSKMALFTLAGDPRRALPAPRS